MRRIWLTLAVLLAGLGPVGEASAASAARPLSAQTTASPVAAGPAWWRIDNGAGAVLWILGMPDGMLTSVHWNDAALSDHLAHAQSLIEPVLGPPLVMPPSSRTGRNPYYNPRSDGSGSVDTLNPTRSIHLPSPDFSLPTAPQKLVAVTDQAHSTGAGPPVGGPVVEFGTQGFWELTIGGTAQNRTAEPLDKALPSDLLTRVRSIERGLPIGARGDVELARIDELVRWIDVWNWPAGELGNPVTTRAQTLAKTAGVPVTALYLPALWKPFPPTPIDVPDPITDDFKWQMFKPAGIMARFTDSDIYDPVPPPRAIALTCLKLVLDQRDAGVAAARQAGMDAWARGDVADAIKRSTSGQQCLMGDQPSSDAAAFGAWQAYSYEQALDAVFDTPGETVALVEFDPLLTSGGVIDHYRRLGYDITAPAGG